jgi:hypothetical protein
MKSCDYKKEESVTFRQKERILFLRVLLLFLFISGICACGNPAQKDAYTFSEKARRIKLNVGDIKEITMTSQKDSSWTMVGSSENKEIVDVTSKEDPSEETTTATIPDNGSLVFLVKGVTNGSVRVTFAEKRKGETGPGRTLKTYLVDVVSK